MKAAVRQPMHMIALTAIGLLTLIGSTRSFAQVPVLLLKMDSDPTIVGSFKDKSEVKSDREWDGAIGENALWEQDSAAHKDWYVEEQRNEFMSAWDAAATGSQPLAHQAEKAFDWAFARENTDGSFSMPDDVPLGRKIHSTAMFVEGASHAFLLLKAANLDTGYINERAHYLTQSAVWLASSIEGSPNANEQLVAAANTYDAGHAHRHYEKAAALQEAALLATDRETKRLLTTAADLSIEHALDPSDPVAQVETGSYDAIDPTTGDTVTVSLKGVNPENDNPNDSERPLSESYDSSYQGLGLYYSELWYACSDNEDLKAQVAQMLRSGLHWESSRFEKNGKAKLAGNTRVAAGAGDEHAPNGAPKVFAYQTAMDAFAYGSQILNDPSFEEKAVSIADYKRWIKN